MLIAISAMHGRHEVSRAWAEHTASLGFDMVCVALTHGDQESADICAANNMAWVWTDNNPLGDKFNAAMRRCARISWGNVPAFQTKEEDARFGRHMILPSDDFISREWVEAMRVSTDDYCYPHSCAIVDAASQQAYNITKLSFGTLKYGAGRVVSRKVVEACGGQLWPSELNKGLDGASHQRITRAGFPVKVVETEGIPITDLKTAENLWPYSTWIGSGRTVTIDEALHMVSPSVRSRIDAMKR